MKNFETKLIALLFALSLLSACGGGGSTSGGESGGDTMTVNVVSLSTPTTTMTYTGSMSTTPALVGIATNSQTVVELAGPTLQVAVCAGGSNASTYPMGLCAAGSGTVTYIITDGTTTTYNGTTGTVTLTSVGDVGQPITGSFDAIVSDTTNTLRVWGSFSITNIF